MFGEVDAKSNSTKDQLKEENSKRLATQLVVRGANCHSLISIRKWNILRSIP